MLCPPLHIELLFTEESRCYMAKTTGRKYRGKQENKN